MEPFKYLHNLIAMPVVALLFITGVVLLLTAIAGNVVNYERFSNKGIWFGGIGTVLTVFSLFLIAGFNHTAFYPSTYNIQNSLTIMNASSSHYTLTAMSYVSLFVPVVLIYIIYVWRALTVKKIDKNELETESHLY